MSLERKWWKRRQKLAEEDYEPDVMSGERPRRAQVRAAILGRLDGYDLPEVFGWDPNWDLQLEAGERQLGVEELAQIQGFVAALEQMVRRGDQRGILEVMKTPVREARVRMGENMSAFEMRMLALNPEFVRKREKVFARVAKINFRPFKKKKELDLERDTKGKPKGLARDEKGRVIITTMEQSLWRWLRVGFLVWMNPKVVHADAERRSGERVRVKVKKRVPTELKDNFIIVDEEGIRVFDPDKGRNGELYRWGDASKGLVFRVDADARISDLLNKLKALVGIRRQTAVFGTLKVVNMRGGRDEVLTEIPMVAPLKWVEAFERVRKKMEGTVREQLETTRRMTGGRMPLFPNDFYKAIPPKLKEAILDVLGEGEVIKARYKEVWVEVGEGMIRYEKRKIGYAAKVGDEVVYDREKYLKLVARRIAELEYDKLSRKTLVQLKHFIAEIVRQAYEGSTGRKLKLLRGWRQKSVEELMEEMFRALDMEVGKLVEKEDPVDGTRYMVWVRGRNKGNK